MSQELVPTTSSPLGISPMPSNTEFDAILRQADVLSRAGIIPAAYRTQVHPTTGVVLKDGAPNVDVTTLTGRTFGWDVLTATRNIHGMRAPRPASRSDAGAHPPRRELRHRHLVGSRCDGDWHPPRHGRQHVGYVGRQRRAASLPVEQERSAGQLPGVDVLGACPIAAV